jgi:hypothetical protein
MSDPPLEENNKDGNNEEVNRQVREIDHARIALASESPYQENFSYNNHPETD